MVLYLDIAAFVLIGLVFGFMLNDLYKWKYPVPGSNDLTPVDPWIIGLTNDGICDSCSQYAENRVVYSDKSKRCDRCSKS